MLRRFDQYPEDALALIAYNVDRQALPAEQKKRLREEFGAIHWRVAMDNTPPTERQAKYPHNLSYKGSIDSKAHASDLIDRILKTGRN